MTGGQIGSFAIALCAAVLQTACQRNPALHRAARAEYLVGSAWESIDNAWFYPNERFSGSWTGLADRQACDIHKTTANGEICDAAIPEAAVQSLQLPIILRVTNLENGVQIIVKGNDRGPASPARLIALNDLARTMLGMAAGHSVKVRMEVETQLSERLKSDMVRQTEPFARSAPVPEVEETTLGQSPAQPMLRDQQSISSTGATSSSRVDLSTALRSQALRLLPVSATQLWIDSGSFDDGQTAATVANEIGGTVILEGSGRRRQFLVRRGPFDNVDNADAALNRARDGGIIGSRIVVQ